MRKTHRLNIAVFLLFMMAISACKLVQSKEGVTLETSAGEKIETSEEPVKLVDHKGVDFKYKLGDKNEFGELYVFDIEFTIFNETVEEIFYLNESCNRLDYFLVLRPDSYKVMPLMQCRATWPMISVLAFKDSVSFKTQIAMPKGSAPIEKIGLDLRTVDKYIPFEHLRENPKLIESIYRQKTPIDRIIWGDNTKTP